MKLSLSLTSIIVIVLVTLNGCSKKENTTELPKTESAPVQVVDEKLKPLKMDIDPKELRSAMISSNGKWTAGEGAKCPNPLIINAKDISSVAIIFEGKSYPSEFIKSGDDLCLSPTGKNPFLWEKFCADGPGNLATAYVAADEQKGAYEKCI